ncbi:hypothetical protein [Enorma phocaeensis]|uniref:hypothetical protein n=1 Tax=Enorma phocaeensis TaxID=1871019 RepID=UPI000C837F7B|nr:hypothetical protein [Enorma phocaeensis]
MKCKSCGEEIGDAKTCGKCGALQDESGETVTEDVPAVDSASEEEGGQSDAEQNADGVRRFCRKCGSELGEGGICPKCGVLLYEEEDNKEAASEEPEREEDDEKSKRNKKSSPRRVIAINLGIAAALLCAIGLVVWYGVDTAYHWEKVDDPGYWETYETGYYIITMDEVNPCYVGQDWTDCIAAHQAEYNRECTKPIATGSRNRTSWETADGDAPYYRAGLVWTGPRNQELCNRYAEMISEMQAEDRPGYYVASLGSWGHLHSTPETDRRLVGRETHDAVCYFGFLGECPEDEEDE